MQVRLRRADGVVAGRRLAAARLAGAATLGMVAQLAVDMSDGYFGAFDRVTTAGWSYMAVATAVAVVGGWGLVRGVLWARVVSTVAFTVNIGLFLPALAQDPVIAGSVVLWHLLLLGYSVFPVVAPPLSPLRTPHDRWVARTGPAVRHLILMSLVLITAVVGYGIGLRTPALVVCLALSAVVLAASWRLLLLEARHGGLTPWLVGAALAIAAVLALSGRMEAVLLVLGVPQLLVLARIVVRGAVFEQLTEQFFTRPAMLVVVSFLVLIAGGTLLLSVPAAASGSALSPLDALFTATSAVCVTGLIVVDTGSAFSPMGQAVILGLIQLGGLNIMVLSTFGALLLGRAPGVRGRQALGAILDLHPSTSATRLVWFIVVMTVTVEAVGAAALTMAWRGQGMSWAESAWHGIFHSVSAFCNAGFALQPDSLVTLEQQPLALLVVAVLIVLGGLGFAVLAALLLRLRRGRREALTVQARLVLVASAVLTSLAAVWILVVEWGSSMAGMSVPERLLHALFQSVTLRTAGFNSIDVTALGPSVLLVMMAMMFIGASPGGTGGGIKTTTTVVLVAAIPAIARGRQQVVVGGRKVSLDTVYRSAAIAVVATLLVLLGGGVLLATQDGSFEAIVFETVSAVGTVGLSLGVTEQLDAIGKIVVVVLMFLGRIGPLTLVLLLARTARSRVSYPEARIMVG